MKLSYAVLLALVAMAAADSFEHSFEDEYSQQSPSNYYSNQESPYNFYERQSSRPRRREGVVSKLKRFFGFGSNRRQAQFTGTGSGPSATGFTGGTTGFTGGNAGNFGGNAGNFGGGGQFVGQQAGFIGAPAAAAAGGGGFPLLPLLLGGLGLAALAALIGGIFLFSQLNNSGRGLDTDEWEVDHSVWMNQLQQDFEDSWDTE